MGRNIFHGLKSSSKGSQVLEDGSQCSVQMQFPKRCRYDLDDVWGIGTGKSTACEILFQEGQKDQTTLYDSPCENCLSFTNVENNT